MAKRGTPETTKKKQAYVRDLLTKTPGLSMNKAGVEVKKKFGTQLAFDKLREAFSAAGGKIDSRRGPKKGSKLSRKKGSRKGRKPSAATAKKIAFVAVLVKANPTATMNAIGVKVKEKFGTQLSFENLRSAFKKAGGKVGKPGRKQGRKTARGAGRRKVDRAAQRAGSVLGSLPRHIIIIQDGHSLDTRKFQTRSDASRYAEKRIGEGVPPSKVAYYEKSQLKVQIGL